MMPRYAMPTKSTRLYSYTNRDQDLVKQGFRAGNFTFLSKFPSKISPFSVTVSIKNKSRLSLTQKPFLSTSRKSTPNPTWMPDSYNLKREHTRRLSQDSAQKRRAISSKEFICSGSPSRQSLRDTPKKPCASVNSSFDSTANQADRVKWIRDTRIKFGSFRLGKSLDDNKNKANAASIISTIKTKLAKDWESTNFDIGLNKNECIELRFERKTVESPEAMHYYMNILINKSQEISKFGLKKTQNRWGVKEPKYLIYVMAPAWVRSTNRSLVPELKKNMFKDDFKKRYSLLDNPRTFYSTRDSNMYVAKRLNNFKLKA